MGLHSGLAKRLFFFNSKNTALGMPDGRFFNHRRDAVFQPQFVNPCASNSSFQEDMLLLCWIVRKSAQTNHQFTPFGCFVRADF